MNTHLATAAGQSTRRSLVALVLAVVLIALAAGSGPARGLAARDGGRALAAKPTIVLVHGAWADPSSWSRVVARLHNDGYTVRSITNPLRSLAADAAYVRTFLESIDGPVVLAAHSYGGAVITNAATGLTNVEALVYVNAFAPDEGEQAGVLAGPDSALSVPDPTSIFDLVPATLPPSPTTDLYLKRSTVFRSFATGLSAKEKALVYATQRGSAFGALFEPSAVPAWRTIPSWYVAGTADRIIPYPVQRMMAERAGSTITKYGAGHLGLMTAPGIVTGVIEKAARTVAR